MRINFPKKRNPSVGMCLSRESLASVKWGKKRPRKRFSWVVCWGLLTQAVCSNIINKSRSCCSSQECGIGGLNSSASKMLYKARRAERTRSAHRQLWDPWDGVRESTGILGLLSGPAVGHDCSTWKPVRDILTSWQF